MSITLQRAYTAAIALNNVGVSLLERGSCLQAREAFLDAMNVMKEISIICAEQVSGKRPLAFSTLDAKLHKASCNLANCVAVKDDLRMNFCVLTEEESPAVIAAALQDENMFFNSSTTFLIRIEKSMRDGEISDVDIESSIILHNFGNVYKCLATTATTASCAKELCEGALKLFEFSFSLLRKHDGDYLPVSILILRSLASFASGLGMEYEAESHYSHMLELEDYFLQTDYMFVESSESAAAAA
jgi:hypothetical protein